MKILLIKPPQNPYLATNSLYEPLDLEYLAASVSDANVRILDMRIDRNLRRELTFFKPDIAGVSAYTCDYNTAVYILKEIKAFDRGIRTVVGGHHATFMPEDFVIPSVDAIFMGYADYTFPQYVNALGDVDKLKKIPNIGIRENDKVFFTERVFPVPDLNSLPMPDRSLIAKYMGRYHDSVRNRMSLVMTSRGCPFRCNFCACWKLMDGKYAARNPESIVNELESLPEKIENVYFSDDNTFHDTDRMWRFSDLMRKTRVKKKLQMYARADTIVRNPDLFRNLTGAGLKYITIGIESFRDSDLDYFKKKTSVEMNDRAIDFLKKLNIYILAHFIVRPEYTKDDFRQLSDYTERHNLFRPAYPVLTPLPGTELYQETKGTFAITNFDFFDFTHSILPTRLEPGVFYRELTDLYMKSFSVFRLMKHRLNRLLSLNREKYFTDNTDGMTVRKLLSVYCHSVAAWIKLRRSFTGRSGRSFNIPEFRSSTA